jgi:hypothetical protein
MITSLFSNPGSEYFVAGGTDGAIVFKGRDILDII